LKSWFCSLLFLSRFRLCFFSSPFLNCRFVPQGEYLLGENLEWYRGMPGNFLFVHWNLTIHFVIAIVSSFVSCFNFSHLPGLSDFSLCDVGPEEHCPVLSLSWDAAATRVPPPVMPENRAAGDTVLCLRYSNWCLHAICMTMNNGMRLERERERERERA
jgi:hypothetical protein